MKFFMNMAYPNQGAVELDDHYIKFQMVDGRLSYISPGYYERIPKPVFMKACRTAGYYLSKLAGMKYEFKLKVELDPSMKTIKFLGRNIDHVFIPDKGYEVRYIGTNKKEVTPMMRKAAGVIANALYKPRKNAASDAAKQIVMDEILGT